MADSKTPKHHARDAFDAGHVPITEEFDSARRSLPAVAPLLAALVVVVVFILGVAYVFRSKPMAQGGIDNVAFSKQAEQPTAMIAIQVDLRNVSDKPLYIKAITATLKTAQGEWTDDAASPSDYPRYLQAYPDLQDHVLKPLEVEAKILPGGEQRGTVIVTFPVDKEQFDARQQLTVNIEPYDQRAIVLKENAK